MRTTHVVTRAHKRSKVQAAATSGASTVADATPLPAETDDVSPALIIKRRRNATLVAGPFKKLRFVVSRVSVTMVRTHADGTESAARLYGLPAFAKRTREGEDRRMEVRSLKRVRRANATTILDDSASNAGSGQMA